MHPGESGRLCDSFEGGGPSGSAGHVRRRVRQSPIGPRACSTHLRAVWARFLAEGWPWSRAQKPVGPRPSLARGRRPPHRRRELPGVCPTQTAPPRPARYSCVSGGRGARPPRWSPWGPRAAGGAWSGFGSCRADSASTRGTLWAAFAARSGCEATCRSGMGPLVVRRPGRRVQGPTPRYRLFDKDHAGAHLARRQRKHPPVTSGRRPSGARLANGPSCALLAVTARLAELLGLGPSEQGGAQRFRKREAIDRDRPTGRRPHGTSQPPARA